VPTYDYQCRACGSVTEVIHSMLEDGPSVCERCGGELRRVFYPMGIIFKGSGFYRTDSRSSTSESTASSSTSTDGVPPTKASPDKSGGSATPNGSTTPAGSGST
jgi:putative FmdB family regulatory protein